jgi:hypothetical protein
MMKNNKILILSFVYLLCGISQANAYLDPGTGSIILQSILAFIAAIGATGSIYWGKIKIIIKKILKKDIKDSKTPND